jgi:DNA-binding MarR family transcriptional regulator
MADLTDDVLVSLRRIIRATDLHSRRLGKQTGLTTPQLVVMRAIEGPGSSTVSAISREVSLSQATVTNILNRLQSHGLVRRKRSAHDRRRVDVSLTAAGRKILQHAPEPLQEEFIARFGALEMWEQHQIVAALQRVAYMMDAENIDAAPMLAPGDQLGVGDQHESSGPSVAVSSPSQGA